jgi:hypothetical protein
MKRARWLTSESQARWMAQSGLIQDWKIIQRFVYSKKSLQCPNGYEVIRIEAAIVNPERDYFGKRFCKGDFDGEGYDNEWEWVDQPEQREYRKIIL